MRLGLQEPCKRGFQEGLVRKRRMRSHDISLPDNVRANLVKVQIRMNDLPPVISREQLHPIGAPSQGSDAAFVNAKYIKPP